MEFSDIFAKHGILLRNLRRIDLAKFTRSRTIHAFSGVNLTNGYVLVFVITSKSRFVVKNALFIKELCKEIQADMGHASREKIIIRFGQICSKSVKTLADWRVINETL